VRSALKRRQETKNVLEIIDQGKGGALYETWDYVSSSADNQTMDKLRAHTRE